MNYPLVSLVLFLVVLFTGGVVLIADAGIRAFHGQRR
jgi:hypothetical protein